MDENRLQAYIDLINELLTCPNGEEEAILRAKEDLIDTGLVEAIAQVAATKVEKGDKNAANWLQSLAAQISEALNNSELIATQQASIDFLVQVLQSTLDSNGDSLAAQISEALNNSEPIAIQQASLDFLLQVLQATWDSNGDALVVYPLLQANLDKLDLFLAYVLQSRIGKTLPDLEPQIAQSSAAGIFIFSNLIQQFPLGNRANNLEIAIVGYDIVLTVFTRVPQGQRSYRFPQDWSTTQNSLGNAYSNRIRGERAENLEIAIACYQAALKERTRDRFPQDHANTSFNLSLAYKDAKRFEDAYQTLESAIDTIESLRDEIISGDEAKQKLAAESNKSYQSMVEVCLELGKYSKAIEYVERSKTRRLVELILTRDLKTVFPQEVVTQLEQLREKIASSQYQLQNGTADNATIQSLAQLRLERNELQNHYLAIGPSFKFDQFRATLDENTAVIEWYITAEGFQTFIFTRHSLKPLVFSAQDSNLKALLNWVNEYYKDYYNDKIKGEIRWRIQLTQRLEELAKILNLDEVIKHVPQQCQRLLLIPHRWLHLFPLHALPVKVPLATDITNNSSAIPTDKSVTYLLDLFPGGVGYAPSCQILLQAQKRDRPNFTQLFAIQNPTRSDQQILHYTDLEVESISQYFASTQILAKENATKSAFTSYAQQLQQTHCLHFSCHGSFEPTSPLESGLLLADGKLTLGEIFAPNFDLSQCRLVTLSACETGLIDFNDNSDEYIGLPSGFLLAGSTAVVSSLWTVGDFATALLLMKFYSNLLSPTKPSVSKALNDAQIWLRGVRKRELLDWLHLSHLPISWIHRIEENLEYYPLDYKIFHKPHYWAAFCAIGI